MKSVYTEEYKQFCSWLINERKAANLTQLEVATLLGKPQSFVSKYENGDRRLDVVEFLQVVAVLGANPTQIISEILIQMDFEVRQQ